MCALLDSRARKKIESSLTYVANAEWPEKRPIDCVFLWGLSSSRHHSESSSSGQCDYAVRAIRMQLVVEHRAAQEKLEEGVGGPSLLRYLSLRTYYGRVG